MDSDIGLGGKLKLESKDGNALFIARNLCSPVQLVSHLLEILIKKLIALLGLGYHFRVSRKEEKLLRGSSRLIYLETRKDGVRFTTLKLKDLNTA